MINLNAGRKLALGLRRTPLACAAALTLLGINLPVEAFPINTDVEGLKLNWDNTVKYSAAARLKSQNPQLVSVDASGNPSVANLDDGDRNFNKGIISSRVDLLSEFDVQYRNVGARLSGAAWYDSVYNRANDNPGFAGGAFPNQSSTAYNQFTKQTRNVMGRKAELLDAFVFGRFDIGEASSVFRFGRHALTWGESLFFGANGIAGGMAPSDYVKLAAVPGTQFKEVIRPVQQVSGQIQLSQDVALGAYYQFRYEANRFPAVGSYFSTSDAFVDGAEQLLIGPGVATPRLADRMAKNRGQGGLQLRFSHAGTDYGLYAIRFHDKSFQAVFAPTGYYLAFHEGITAYGASASHTFGPANVAIEASVRTNQDLASSHAFDSGFYDNRSNPAYAVGNTAHINLSTLWSLNPTPLFNEATVAAEVAWNRVLSCRKHCDDALDTNSTRDAVTMLAIFTPTYRQVVSGLDLNVPITLGYTPKGSRSQALGPGFGSGGTGSMSIGLEGQYLDVWRFGMAFTHYYGAAKAVLDSTASFSYGQASKDRDFVSMSLRRTF